MKISRSIRRPLRRFTYSIKSRLLYRKCSHLVEQLENALQILESEVPVIVVSYNNSVYVQNITNQLNRYKIKPIIIDNCSTSKQSQSILSGLEQAGNAHIIRSKYNFGHEVGFLQPVYDVLPELFCYTDPDLELNKNLPNNFISTLISLTTEFNVYKAGFALSLKGHGPLRKITIHSRHTKPFLYEKHISIEEFESRYWVYRLMHDTYELYAAPIDTTFAAYRKSNYFGDFHHAIRVAGDFSAIHLPWFEELDLLNKEQRASYRKNNKSSNWV